MTTTTLTKTKTTTLQRDDACVSCGRRLKTFKHAWVSATSKYCTKACATTHQEQHPMTTTTTTSDDTKTQQRATCSACFAEQAITKRGALVAHGYTRPQQWHQNVGTCDGAGQMHFGTTQGRDYTQTLAQRVRDAAQGVDVNAADVLAGRAPVMGRKRIAGSRVYTMTAIENVTQSQRQQYAATLTQQAQQMREHARELDAAVAKWVAVAPKTVRVEAKQTLLHMRDAGRRFGGKLCASSAMGALKGYTTSDVASVTCEKCKALIARRQSTK